MAEMMTLEAEARAGGGKGPARQLRRAGRVPAVIYGEGKPQDMISVETRALRRELGNPRFFSTLFALRLDGGMVQVLPRDVQLHPVSDVPIHADFIRVSAGTTVTVDIPVVFLNEDDAPGLKRGGVLNVVRREIELVCPADAIPAEIVIDLLPYDIGDSIHISQVTLPEGVQPTITDRDFTVATIAAPTLHTEAEEAEEAEEGEEVEGAEDVEVEGAEEPTDEEA
jgi:large subunit ribosomal protein L25